MPKAPDWSIKKLDDQLVDRERIGGTSEQREEIGGEIQARKEKKKRTREKEKDVLEARN